MNNHILLSSFSSNFFEVKEIIHLTEKEKNSQLQVCLKFQDKIYWNILLDSLL